jgi:acetylornithine deacetylase/succinyl-diaminopimelate desuccinylase-like protein
VESYFRQLAQSAPPDPGASLADPASALADPARRQQLLADPFRAACLRRTVSVTGLSAGGKANVIPGEASALIDRRLLPGDDPKEFLELLRKAAAIRPSGGRS